MNQSINQSINQSSTALAWLIVIFAVIATSCTEMSSLNSSMQQNEQLIIEQSAASSGKHAERFHRILQQERKHYQQLEKLAETIAKNEELHHNLIEAMKASTVKEHIINISKHVQQTDGYLFKNEKALSVIESLAERFNAPDQAKGLKRFLSEDMNYDINVYFPIKEHRKRVFEHNESFYVAFNPPHAKYGDEYELWAYHPTLPKRKISSTSAPDEPIMVVAYSEYQEEFSSTLNGVGDNEDLGHTDIICMEGDPCNEPPPPQFAFDNLQVSKIKTKGIDDGWLDGDLELRITVRHNYIQFMSKQVNHDAGHWKWYAPWVWVDSNKWTNVHLIGRVDLDPAYYNQPIFLLDIRELDPFEHDDYVFGYPFNLFELSYYPNGESRTISNGYRPDNTGTIEIILERRLSWY